MTNHATSQSASATAADIDAALTSAIGNVIASFAARQDNLLPILHGIRTSLDSCHPRRCR